MILFNRSFVDMVFAAVVFIGVVFVVALVVSCNGVCQGASSPPDATRSEIAAALKSAFPGAAAERRAQARQFLSLYTAAGELPAAEQARFKVRLKSRLARLASSIQQDLLEARRVQAAQSTRDSPTAGRAARPSDAKDGSASRPTMASSPRSTVGLSDRLSSSTAPSPRDARPKTAGRAGGAGAPDEGQSLVDLIQATIAPETWDVNGGSGVIRYWPAGHALVVRQTDEVHEQIGGIVHGVRK